MLRSETFAKIAAAIAEAQAELKNPVKDKEASIGAKFSYRYADFATALERIRPITAKNKIAIVQTPRMEAREMILETHLIHESGEWIGCDYPVCTLNADHRTMGSALSYARRYSLFPMLGIQGEDDDDDGAADQASRANRAPPPPPPTDLGETIGAFYLRKIANARTKAEFDESVSKARDAASRMTRAEVDSIAKQVPEKAKKFTKTAASPAAVESTGAVRTAPTPAPVAPLIDDSELDLPPHLKRAKPPARNDGEEAYGDMLEELKMQTTKALAEQWWELRRSEVKALPLEWREAITADYEDWLTAWPT